MADNFDIMVINLRRATQRWRKMVTTLQDIWPGKVAQRVEAVDSKRWVPIIHCWFPCPPPNCGLTTGPTSSGF